LEFPAAAGRGFLGWFDGWLCRSRASRGSGFLMGYTFRRVALWLCAFCALLRCLNSDPRFSTFGIRPSFGFGNSVFGMEVKVDGTVEPAGGRVIALTAPVLLRRVHTLSDMTTSGAMRHCAQCCRPCRLTPSTGRQWKVAGSRATSIGRAQSPKAIAIIPQHHESHESFRSQTYSDYGTPTRRPVHGNPPRVHRAAVPPPDARVIAVGQGGNS
jgi:hypothetical protein